MLNEVGERIYYARDDEFAVRESNLAKNLPLVSMAWIRSLEGNSSWARFQRCGKDLF